ncbi:phenylacetate-CoA oxygenase subunit PaaJ [Streptomyces sp. P38-E01]|uniref:Phenylacetate-CoA oxygenase subunit PaaJ n=1 Tax=Streptomyces tardus TaxID=2780544 RepID=A0A949JDG1_9ACTN|nr:phenylacetate-CoA oxygenase subunit PaaJ [Streptomyces tardus]
MTHTARPTRPEPGTPTAAETPDVPETPDTHALEAEALALAGAVPDPELPQLSLADLGVVRGVARQRDGVTEVRLTPTYTGCPAVETMAEDIREALSARRFGTVRVVRVLSPAWTTDDITDEGRRKLAEAGIAPPRSGGPAADGPVPLSLAIRCPNCGSVDTELLSRFSSTACKALRRCTACREPFDHFKELL